MAKTQTKRFWMSEKVFLKYIKEAFEYDDNLQLHRRNVGATQTKGGRFVRFGEPGQSDLFGTIVEWTCPCCGRKREGVTVEIEVKSIDKNGKCGILSPAQKRWQESVRLSNGVAITVYPVETDPIRLRQRIWRLIGRELCPQCEGR
jgi:hypothetical protein